MAMIAPICLITGGPGSGKTFVTSYIVKAWKKELADHKDKGSMGGSVALCAPTGMDGTISLRSYRYGR